MLCAGRSKSASLLLPSDLRVCEGEARGCLFPAASWGKEDQCDNATSSVFLSVFSVSCGLFC